MTAALDERGLPTGYPLQAGWEVAPRAVRAMLDADGPVLLLDCRLDREVAAARIEGATHIPMQDIPGRLPEIEDMMEDAGAERLVVF